MSATSVEGRRSIPATAIRVTRKAVRATPLLTSASRAIENGSSSPPATPAVTAMPRIIMIQVVAAAAGLRAGATRLAKSASSDVPAAPTPRPIIVKATIARAMPPN